MAFKSLARLLPFALILAAPWLQAAAAQPVLEGTKAITLVTASGERLAIGHVTFTPDDGGALFRLELDSPDFRPEFLSMRPFRCLHDPKEWWCHLDYPYGLKRRVSSTDLTDLEYALLFITKGPNAFGIDAWNGLYFKLSAAADGSIEGDLHETDLNALAVPPDDPFARVITQAGLTHAEPASHRFARVEIH